MLFISGQEPRNGPELQQGTPSANTQALESWRRQRRAAGGVSDAGRRAVSCR